MSLISIKKVLTAAGLTFLLMSSPIAFAQDKTSEKDSAMETVILYVNINEDDAEKMSDLLKGIGLKKAELIVRYREEVGPFKTVEQLMEIRGIGPKIIEQNQLAIVLE